MRRMWKKTEPAATATPAPAARARRTNNINNGAGEKKDATKMEGTRSVAQSIAALILSLAIKGFIHNTCGRGRRSECV